MPCERRTLSCAQSTVAFSSVVAKGPECCRNGLGGLVTLTQGVGANDLTVCGVEAVEVLDGVAPTAADPVFGGGSLGIHGWFTCVGIGEVILPPQRTQRRAC